MLRTAIHFSEEHLEVNYNKLDFTVANLYNIAFIIQHEP